MGYIHEGRNFGIDFLSGELKVTEPISEFVVNDLNEIIESKEKDYDYVIIDTAAGTHCDVIAALEGCDIALAVTEPTPLGAHDLKLIMELLKVLKIARMFSTDIIAEIPYSKEFIESYSKGEPIQDKGVIRIVKEIVKWKK